MADLPLPRWGKLPKTEPYRSREVERRRDWIRENRHQERTPRVAGCPGDWIGELTTRRYKVWLTFGPGSGQLPDDD